MSGRTYDTSVSKKQCDVDGNFVGLDGSFQQLSVTIRVYENTATPQTNRFPPDFEFDATDPKDWVIRIHNLGKRFDIYKNDRNRLMEFFGNRSHHEEHWSLRNINLEIQKGECFESLVQTGLESRPCSNSYLGSHLPPKERSN